MNDSNRKCGLSAEWLQSIIINIILFLTGTINQNNKTLTILLLLCLKIILHLVEQPKVCSKHISTEKKISLLSKEHRLLKHFYKLQKLANWPGRIRSKIQRKEKKSAVGVGFINACDKTLSGPDWHLSFTSSRIKINQSSGQHGELQTAESPLKTLSAESVLFSRKVNMKGWKQNFSKNCGKQNHH